MPPSPPLSRRALLRLSLALGSGLLPALPDFAIAESSLVDPYSGSIPLTFPLQTGTYKTPVVDNWHQPREGPLYPWSHRTADTTRAHDGVDVYPLASQSPQVYAPLAGTVAAVCVRAANRLDAAVTYRVSGATPPPWDYSQAFDDVSKLPLYGNFVWLVSSDPRSAGYFVLFAHLQNEALINGLAPDQPITPATAVGAVGDTGNAAGTPQLHVELHYPAGSSFACKRCSPARTLTSFDSLASLRSATQRGEADAPAPAALPSLTSTAAPTTAGNAPTCTYSAGWNLVSAPAGSIFNQATGPLYTMQAGDADYETVPNSRGVTGGWGYWAYFATDADVALSGVNASTALVQAPPGQFVLIGNPSATQTVSVEGADAVWTYDARSGAYAPTATLAPGQGAWAFSFGGATLRLAPASSSPPSTRARPPSSAAPPVPPYPTASP